MKKIIAIILLLSSLCVLLCACGGYKKAKTFSEDFLKSVSLEEMPLPESKNCWLNSSIAGQETMKLEMNRTDFNIYVKSFAEYMSSREDIYYFGREYSDGLIAEMLPHTATHELDESFRAEGDKFVFTYSLKDELTVSNKCEHMKYKSLVSVTLDYDGEESLAYISLREGSGLGTGCIDEALATPYVFTLDHSGEYYRLEGVRGDLSGEVYLPESFQGLPVREISLWGFKANGEGGSTGDVTKVVIPDSYVKIGTSAFNNLHELKTVIIGDGVKEIGPSAFEGCEKLETVLFGDSVEAIYAEAFQYCEKLDNVVLPASLKEITYRAFSECKSLKTIIIPRGVAEMSVDVFYENDNLTDIYCEIEAQPDGWDEEWCGNYKEYLTNSDVRVTFGYGGDSPVVYNSVSFDTIGSYDPVFLEKFSYLRTAGSEVTFYLNPVEGSENATMYLNGVLHSVGVETEIPEEGGAGTKILWKYTFTMPEEHATVSFEIVEQ